MEKEEYKECKRKEYTISSFLADKIIKEDEISELYKERERIEEEIREKENRYKLFVNNYLHENGLQIKNFEED